MMDWDKLRVFHAVATAKSFTHAAEKLNLSQSAISRQISTLEENLQTELFHRHARGLLLTEQGDILLRAVGDVFSRLAAAENALLDSKERPKGPFKIAAPTAIGTMWLVPHMREFGDLYPEIDVTLLVSDRELDLTKREADAAIRLSPATHPDLVQKKLTTLNNSLYASAEYLRTHGIPKRTEHLANHRLIVHADDGHLPFAEVNWMITAGLPKGQEHRPFFRINSLRGMLKAVESGVGIAGLPDYMVHDLPGVTKVMPELRGPATDVYFTYSVELRNSKRVRVFKEFLMTKLDEDGLLNKAA